MSAASSSRHDAGDPSTGPSTDPSTGAAEQLRATLHEVTQRVAALQAEHDQLMGDPDAIQEDRDATALVLEHARRELATTREALARLDDGSYGRCTRCGNDIGAERLAAIANVTTCVQCAG